MPGRVGQCLRHDVVRADLNLLRWPRSETDVDPDGDRGAAGKRPQRRTEAAVGQDRRVDAARDLAQLVQRAGHPGDGAVKLRGELGELRRHGRLCPAQLQRQRDEPLLGSVVQVPLDPAARLVGGGHDARPGGDHLGLRPGVCDGGGHQLGEAGQPCLDIGRQQFLIGKRHDHDAHSPPSTLTGTPTEERNPQSCPATWLHALDGEAARDDAASGELVLEGRTGETASGNGTRVWAGRIADSFYIDLSLLALINGAVAKGTAPGLSGWRPQDAKNSFAGSLVYSIVLEVPHTHPQLRPGARAGVWAATKLATDAGGWRQINRAGHPMMWPIFWPDDTDFTNPANTRHPSQDVSAAAKYIGEQIAAVVAAAGTSDDPEAYGQTVAGQLFPDVLPYVVGTPAVYGFAGFNGRTWADNAPEAMLSLVTSNAVPSGLKPATTKDQRASTFPYVVPA